MTTITVDVSPQGEIRLETRGYHGAACREASRDLERALGLVTSDRPTAEQFSVSVGQATARRQSLGGPPGGPPS